MKTLLNHKHTLRLLRISDVLKNFFFTSSTVLGKFVNLRLRLYTVAHNKFF